MKKIFICLLSIFLMISLAACGSGETETASTAGELTRKLKSNSDKVIEVSEDIVLTKAIEIVGNKEIVGSGSITVSVADMEDGYVISLSDGASLTVGGSVQLDLSSLAGGIHVKEGAELILQDEAVVTGASVKAANVLVEGTFTMNGGFLKYAKGHNLINKGNTTIAGGELKGSGSKYAIVYNEGTLVQNGGTIVGGYHNVVGAAGSSFEWNKGEITTSLLDAIVIEEGASIHVTSANAKLTGVYAKGLVVNGEGVIDGATMKDSMDSMVAVGINGKLTLNGGKITEAGIHGIDNAGTLLMTAGVVFQNAHSGICNTGTLNITGGDIMNNGSKGVLNKSGVATITSADVMITGNDEGVSNEIGAYFELSAANIIQNVDCNVYAYGGDMYIHDIALSSSKAASISVISADVTLENVDIQGTTGGSGAHGIYMTGGHVAAKKVNFNAINGSGLRLDGEAAVFEGKNITFDNIQRNVFYVTAGKADVDGFTTKDVQNYNVYATGGELTLANATLCKTYQNNVRTKNDTVLNLKNVVILGNTEEVAGTVYGLIIDDGTVTAKNLTIKDTYAAAIRLKGGEFTADKVTITNAGKHGINAAGGVGKITNLKTTNVTGCNVYMTSAANLTLTDAELGKCTDNSIKEYGKEDAVLNLINVTVLGHTEDALESVHGLIIDDGTVTAKNLKIQDVVSAALRVRGGSFKAEDVVVSNPGLNGVYMNGGTADITGFEISTAPSYGVYMTGGIANITDLKTSDIRKINIYLKNTANLTVTGADLGECMSHGIKVEEDTTAELKLKDVTIRGQKEEANPEGYIYGLLVNSGNVTANNLTISNVVRDGVCVTGGSFTADGVNVSEASRYGVNVTGGVTDITNLTTSDITNSNIYATGDAQLTVTGANLGKCGNHSIQTKAATEEFGLNLTKVNVLGATDEVSGKYAILVTSGSVTAKDLEVSDVDSKGVNDGVCVTGGSFTAENVTVSDVERYGVYVTSGVADITNLTTSDISTSNIYVKGDAQLTVTGADLGKSGSHSIQTQSAKEDLVLNLTKVNVLGATDKVSGKYAILVTGGSVTAKDLEVSDVDSKGVNDGVCVTGGSFTAENVTVSDVERYGVYVTTAGTAEITGLTVESAEDSGVCVKKGSLTLNGADITGTKNGVYVIGGTLTLNGAEVTGTAYDIYNTTNTLRLEGVIKADVYNDAAVTVNAGSLAGSDMTIDWIEVAEDGTFTGGRAVAEGFVGIQFDDEAAMTATSNSVVEGTDKASVRLGENVRLNVNDANGNPIVPVVNYYNSQMVLVDKDNVLYTVDSYDGLIQALNDFKNKTNPRATITIKGDINVSEKVAITKDITLVDDGTVRKIVVAGEGEFEVANNASLTFKSTGTDEEPKLVVNSTNGAMAEALGAGSKVTVNKGVEFTNNQDNAINMNDGTWYINGGKFNDNDIHLASGAEVRLSGKIVAEIINEGANVLYVDGALESGSDVKVEWNSTVPTDGIIFASDDVMNASKPYISLGTKVFANYSLAYVNATDTTKAVGKLVTPIVVSNAAEWATAWATIGTNKIGVIRLATNINVSGKIEIPADCNVTIEDNGSGTAYTLAKVADENFDMFYLQAGSSLTLRSTGTVNNCKLILTGLTTTTSASTAMINLEQDNCAVSIYNGVALKDNSSAKGGGAICINKASATFNVNGACFENISAGANGGAIYLKSEGTINNSIFKDCSATAAGGAIILYSRCDITDTNFDNCSSGTHGGAIYNSSGNLTLTGTSSKALFDSNKTGDNSGGGAIYMTGGAATLTVTGYTFKGNSAKNGGAIYVNAGTCNIKNTKFDTCNATNAGAAIYSKGTLSLNGTSTNAVITNCLCSNITEGFNTAIYLNGGTLTGSGYSFEAIDENNKFLKTAGGAKNNSSYN